VIERAVKHAGGKLKVKKANWNGFWRERETNAIKFVFLFATLLANKLIFIVLSPPLQ
jgi:hypothetical protein